MDSGTVSQSFKKSNSPVVAGGEDLYPKGFISRRARRGIILSLDSK